MSTSKTFFPPVIMTVTIPVVVIVVIVEIEEEEEVVDVEESKTEDLIQEMIQNLISKIINQIHIRMKIINTSSIQMLPRNDMQKVYLLQ